MVDVGGMVVLLKDALPGIWREGGGGGIKGGRGVGIEGEDGV